ncbi:uncharacterized protein [Panulirus ornatus]|uniref:uncharacterized protein isoform X2 n=1 Tax=Panulirus ornatus TaxID=150431 RepID=UPI003A8717F4
MVMPSAVPALLVMVAAVNTDPTLDEPVVVVSGVVGGKAELPCRFAPQNPGDQPKLILWYKTGFSRPLFSHDSRVPQVQADLSQAGGELRLGPGAAPLVYHNLTLQHAGLYECRVDFFRSRAYTSLVNLTVVEPVRSVEIVEGQLGPARKGVLGPYHAGQTIHVSCLSRHGWPPPVLTWWLGKRMLKSSREVTAPGQVQNDLVIEDISRSWHDKTLTCTANNTRLAEPASASVHIQMLLMPSRVSIVNPGPVVVGRQALLRCTSVGSNPPPTLSWTLNGTAIHGHKSVVEGSMTWSSLAVNVTRAHNNIEVSCTATNPTLHGARLSNTTTLTVHYPPSVSLSLGRSLQPESLREGVDVYFTCTVSASPPASPITWFHQGQVAAQNVSGGVVMSGDSLVLQGVRRQQAGQYRCGAANPLARVVSAPVRLRIKLTSHPPVRSIQWQWKNGDDVISTPVSGGTERESAHLTVQPLHGGEDRTLSCWGVNEMGTQDQPCRLSVKEVAVPRSSCTVANISSTSLSLACHTTRLPPHATALYTAEVYFENQTLFANITSNRPTFNVSRLDAGTSYQIKVYVTHGPVTSQPVLVSAYTASTAESSPESDGEVGGSNVVGGVVGGVVVTVVIVGGAVCGRICCVRRVAANKRKALCLPPADDTRPMLHAGPSSEMPRRRPSTLDLWRSETEDQAATAQDGSTGDSARALHPDTGGGEDGVVATVEDIFKVVVNPRRQTAAMKKIDQEDELSGDKAQEAAKEVDNYLGEWLQLFPKESENALTKKLQYVSKEDDEHIGEWLQHLPQDAQDYPGGWVISNSRQDINYPNADLQLFPKKVEAPPGGWRQKSSEGQVRAGEGTERLPASVSGTPGEWLERSPQGAEGFDPGTPQRPHPLAESYGDWSQKYRTTLPEGYRRKTLQNPRRAAEYHGSTRRKLPRDADSFQRWTMQYPPKLPDNHPLRSLQYPSNAAEISPGRLLQHPREMPENQARRMSRYGSRKDRDMSLKSLKRDAREKCEQESEELPCSVQQLMFSEETIL